MDPQALVSKVGDAYSTISDIEWQHRTLYGTPLPIPPSQLIAQADALKLSPAAYAERTWNFTAKKNELAEAAKKAHEEQIKAATAAEKDKEWQAKLDAVRSEAEASRKKMAEGMNGNNPDVKIAISSKVAEIARATNAGERKSPLAMTDAERRQATRHAIHKEIEQNQPAVA
jgi:hypothetical protein